MKNSIEHAALATRTSVPGLSWGQQRRLGQQLAGIDSRTQLEHHAIGAAADLTVARTIAAGYVTSRALEAAARLSSLENAIVEMETTAVHRVAYIGQKATLLLGQIIDDFGFRITS